MIYPCEKLLGVNFTILTKKDILEEVRKRLKSSVKRQVSNVEKRGEPLVIFTPNPEIVIFAQKNPLFRKIVNSAQINIPDGAGIVWAMKKLYNLEISRITGVDLMIDLCEMSAKEGFKIGLIGGRDKVALKAAECLRVKIPDVKIIVLPSPEIILDGELSIKNKELSIDKRKNKRILNTQYLILNTKGKQIKETEKYFISLLKKLHSENISLLFVALGFPKQEYFIDRIKNYKSSIDKSKPLVLMSVGGAFDYISGRVPRAPIWMRERGLEWLYRLIREPWRLPRQIKGAEFFLKILL